MTEFTRLVASLFTYLLARLRKSLARDSTGCGRGCGRGCGPCLISKFELSGYMICTRILQL